MTEPALLPTLLRMATGLVVVVTLILACAWLARRAGWLARPGARLLRQVDQLSLGPRGSVAVVAVNDTWLVLGVTTGQITVLHHLPAPDDAVIHHDPKTPATSAPNAFATLLHAIRPRPRHVPATALATVHTTSAPAS